jgi:hypothetical protein
VRGVSGGVLSEARLHALDGVTEQPRKVVEHHRFTHPFPADEANVAWRERERERQTDRQNAHHTLHYTGKRTNPSENTLSLSPFLPLSFSLSLSLLFRQHLPLSQWL